MPAETDRAFRQTRFLLSAARLEQLPDDGRPEVAFAGRSNAGKSSALNVLCAQRQLARVSKTPGRTQLLNVFELAAGRLVDLPGYGYAKVPSRVRRDWGELVTGYVESRESLRGVVVVMDARHPLTDADRQLLDWLAEQGLPRHVLLTKIDKLSPSKARTLLREVRAELGAEASAQVFSAQTREGLDEAREVVMAFFAK